nr:hypothetical protein BaRGS_005029 [Batillaria attramentaria]
MERIQLSEEDFLTGHLREDESVAVDAFFEDGVLCSVIHSHDEIYVTEPSWRHIPHSGNHSVIAYRGSDIRWRVSFPPPPVLQDNTAHDSLASEGGKRERRASETWAKNRCPLRVVADHKFFSIHAFNRTVTAAQIMIWTIQMANRILTTTVWDKTGLTNIGIHIKEAIASDIAELKERTLTLETTFEKLSEKQEDVAESVEDLQEDLKDLQARYEEELDKLEAFSRRDNLRFFGLTETPGETFGVLCGESSGVPAGYER